MGAQPQPRKRAHRPLRLARPTAPASIPAAGAGCNLLTSADVLTWFVVPSGGTVEAGSFVPVDPYLIGVTFYNQMGQVEVGPNFGIVHVGSSNALAMTIGVL